MTIATRHLTTAELEAGLDEIRGAPKDGGRLELIVRRPHVGERVLLEQGELSKAEGLVGDSWRLRYGERTPNTEVQLTLMNARVTALVAQDKSRWPLAGDQLYVDLDLSDDNLPAGARLSIGSAIVEVSAIPHTGCAKFVERFGMDAMNFVNSPVGKSLHLRGINTRVVRAGTFRVGDRVTKVSSA
jgi:hypothetical protein